VHIFDLVPIMSPFLLSLLSSPRPSLFSPLIHTQSLIYGSVSLLLPSPDSVSAGKSVLLSSSRISSSRLSSLPAAPVRPVHTPYVPAKEEKGSGETKKKGRSEREKHDVSPYYTALHCKATSAS
jgi:hypothetical protein